MTQSTANEQAWMRRALELAERGEGRVEPNPMVGCVVVREGRVIGEGWHREYGGLHAETDALASCREDPRGATLFVTLEPCCHEGKQPPCTRAILDAGISRVVVACEDPFPEVSGEGVRQLRESGLDVRVGLMESEGLALTAPFRKRVLTGKPWVIAKWAATLDGKIATREGDSRWISSPGSREIVHRIRGRVDAVMVGRGTAMADDPRLDARPPGPRAPRRIVFDSQAQLSLDSQLVATVDESAVTLVCGPAASAAKCQQLSDLGVDVWRFDSADANVRLLEALERLGTELQATNVLAEGGGGLLGALFDAGEVDEVHAFIAPKIVGGGLAVGPIQGLGIGKMSEAAEMVGVEIDRVGPDVYVRGRVCWERGKRVEG